MVSVFHPFQVLMPEIRMTIPCIFYISSRFIGLKFSADSDSNPLPFYCPSLQRSAGPSSEKANLTSSSHLYPELFLSALLFSSALFPFPLPFAAGIRLPCLFPYQHHNDSLQTAYCRTGLYRPLLSEPDITMT